MKQIDETCPRCRGWVWHRRELCNCKPAILEWLPSDEENYPALIGKRLRATREAAGLSMDELAEKVGMSKTGLWQIEVGRSEPMARTIVSLAIILGVTTDFLLMRE
jgi:DNA-binding XRE family transcriptional regulator